MVTQRLLWTQISSLRVYPAEHGDKVTDKAGDGAFEDCVIAPDHGFMECVAVKSLVRHWNCDQ